MPIDERWDRLSDDQWSSFAAAWLAQLRNPADTMDRDYGESETLMEFSARAEHQWKFILAAIGHAQTDDDLGHIGAGPIEHLLGWHGAEYIERVEFEAARNPALSRALTMIYKYMMSDMVWSRVQVIQERTREQL